MMRHANGAGWTGYAETTGVRSATILADIHAVYPALQAVLDEEADDPSDLLVVLGDTAAGPMPNETVELLRAHEDRLVAISGNADRNIVELHDGRLTDPASDLTLQEAATVNGASLAWLRTLPETVIISIGPLGRVFCCHAVPANDMDIVLVDTPVERWQEVLAPVPDRCGTLLLGHTHMPFQRLAVGKRIVNPGSVGMPFGESGAHWLRIVDGRFEQRKTSFDREAARETIRASSTIPAFDSWIGDYLDEPPDDIHILGLLRSRQRPADSTRGSEPGEAPAGAFWNDG